MQFEKFKAKAKESLVELSRLRRLGKTESDSHPRRMRIGEDVELRGRWVLHLTALSAAPFNN